MEVRTAIVIAAGGRGERLGGDKPGRMLAGRSLLERTVAIARGWSRPLAVSVRTVGAIERYAVEIIQDDPCIDGPLAALEGGFRFAQAGGCTHVLLIACDMPFLSPDLLPRLEGAIGKANAALPVTGDRAQTMAGLWRVDPGSLSDYLATGRRSLWRFAERQEAARIRWACEPGDPFFDVDDEATLEEARRRIASQTVCAP